MATPASSPASGEGIVRDLVLGVALFALAVVVFFPAFHGGFLWGDDQLLTANPQIHDPDGWWTLWLRPRTADYFPLTSATFWIEWRLWGFSAPGGYHVTNVLLHAVAVVLTWRLLELLRVPGAWFAAAIFAVHPVCVESVAWIAERTNTLSQIFVLLSVMLYVRFLERGWKWGYVGSLVCFTLALLAKTSVIMLPVILLLLAWWCDPEREEREEFPGRHVIGLLPFCVVAVPLGLIAINFQFTRAIGGEIIPIGNLWQRACSACFAAGFYLYSVLWPFNITAVYPQWHRAFPTAELFPQAHITPPAPEALTYWQQIIPGLLIAALLGWCWLRRGEAWGRATLVALGCYFIAMLPVLGFVTMSYMRLTLVADHFQYISMIAVIALLVAAGYQRALRPVWMIVAAAGFACIAYLNWGWTQERHLEEVVWIAGVVFTALALSWNGEGSKLVWSGCLGVVILCCAAVSWTQAATYQNEEAYWSAALPGNPSNWQAHNHLGAAQYMRGDIKDAAVHFARAVELKPDNPESHNNLGLTQSYFGKKDDAIRQFELAVEIKDDSAMDTNLANAYEAAMRFDDAIRMYRHALSLNASNASAWCNLGYALMSEGRKDEAIPCFMKTIELDPTMPQGPTDLYRSLQLRGINPAAPVLSGTYPFDAQKALDLIRTHPPPPQSRQ